MQVIPICINSQQLDSIPADKRADFGYIFSRAQNVSGTLALLDHNVHAKRYYIMDYIESVLHLMIDQISDDNNEDGNNQQTQINSNTLPIRKHGDVSAPQFLTAMKLQRNIPSSG